MLLLLFLLLLLPLPALAQVTVPAPPPQHDPPQGINVIPDGKGGVTYWRGQGGTDAYTAMIIGQGLMQLSKPAYRPPTFAPTLTVKPGPPLPFYGIYDHLPPDRR